MKNTVTGTSCGDERTQLSCEYESWNNRFYSRKRHGMPCRRACSQAVRFVWAFFTKNIECTDDKREGDVTIVGPSCV